MRLSSRVVDLAGPPPRTGPETVPDTLVDALAAVAAAVRAGAPPAAGWAAAGVRAPDGVPAAEDLGRLRGATPAHVRAVLAVCRVTAATGAPPASVLDRVLDGLAGDVTAAQARRVAVAGPRATARLLAWLPVVGVLLGLALGADPVGVLLDGGPGTAVAATGVLLAAVGRRWARALVRSALTAAGTP